MERVVDDKGDTVADCILEELSNIEVTLTSIKEVLERLVSAVKGEKV